MKWNTFFFVRHVGRFTGSTNQNFTFLCILQNTYADLGLQYYSQQRPSNRLMLSFMPRASIQIDMRRHGILHSHLRRVTESVTSSVVVTSTFIHSMSPKYNTQPLQNLTHLYPPPTRLCDALSHTNPITGDLWGQD